MKRGRRVLIVVGIVVIAVVCAVVVLRTQGQRGGALLGDLLTQNFGKARNIEIGIGSVGGSLFRDARATDFRITYTGSDTPRLLLEASEVYVKYDLMSFFKGAIKIDSVALVSPKLVMPVAADGRRIYPQGDPVGGGPGRDILLRALSATDLSAVWEAGKPWMVRALRLEGGYAKRGEVSTLEVTGEHLTYGDAARLDRVALSLRTLPDRVEVSEARFVTPGSAFTVAGFFGTGENDSIAADVRLDSLAVEEIPALVGGAAGAQPGWFAGTLRVRGLYSDLGLEAALAGRYGALDFKELEFAGAYSGKELEVERLACLLNGSSLEVSGTVKFAAPAEYSATATFAGLDLSRFAGSSVAPSDLSGSLIVRGRGFARKDLEVNAWPSLSAGSYGDWPFDAVAGRVELTPDAVQLDSVAARIGGTEAVATGAIQYSGRTDLAFNLNCPDLADLVPYHRIGGLGGEVSGDVRLTVDGGRISVSGRSLGRGIDYQGAYLESLLVNVSLDQPGGDWAGRGDLLATSLNIRGFKAGRMVGEVAVGGGVAAIERVEITRPNGDLLSASGVVSRRGPGYLAKIGRLVLEVGEYAWRNREPIEVSYGADSLAVLNLALSSEMGTLSVSSASFARGRYVLAAEAGDLDLGRLKQALGADIPSGLMGFKLKLGGGADDLDLDLEFLVRNGEMRSVEFNSLGGRVSYRDGMLNLEDVVLSQTGGSAEVDGRIPIDLSPRRLSEVSKAGNPEELLEDLGEISLRATGIDISIFRPVVPQLARLDGVAELDLAVGGPAANPHATSRGTLRHAMLGETAVGDVTWDLAFRDSLLRVASLEITRDASKVLVTGTLPLALSVSPVSGALPPRPIDLEVKAENGDLSLLCEFVPKLKEFSGTYGADLKIGGLINDPTFEGRFSLARAKLRLEGVAEGFEDLNLTGQADGKRLVITSATAEGGALKASGHLDLKGAGLSGYEFTAAMKRFPVTEFEDFYVILGGDITVRSKPVEGAGVIPSIEGAVVIEEGEYLYSPQQLGGGGGTGAQAAPTWLMDLGVEIPHDFWIRGGGIEAELEGSLNVRRGSEGLLVLGMLRTIRGTFSIYNNDFRITSGEFRFTDVKSIGNVYIDLEATSRVLDERVDITATGKMENLDVTATSESGWSETQIFEAIALRRGSQSEGEAGAKFFSDELLRSWGVAMVNRLGDDVARDLRLDEFGVEIGDVGGGDVLSATRVTFGKYVSDKIYLQYTQSLGRIYGGSGNLSQRDLTNPERQFQVEYRLSDRFSMEGEAGTVGGLGYFDVDLKFKLGY